MCRRRSTDALARHSVVSAARQRTRWEVICRNTGPLVPYRLRVRRDRREEPRVRQRVGFEVQPDLDRAQLLARPDLVVQRLVPVPQLALERERFPPELAKPGGNALAHERTHTPQALGGLHQGIRARSARSTIPVKAGMASPARVASLITPACVGKATTFQIASATAEPRMKRSTPMRTPPDVPAQIAALVSAKPAPAMNQISGLSRRSPPIAR